MKLQPCKHCGAPAHLVKSVTDPHLCWPVQRSNLDCGISTRLFAQQDMAVAAWQRVAYGHRNGETEAPSETDLSSVGRYWFKGIVTSDVCKTYDISDIVECSLHQVYNDVAGETLPKERHVGQWWGPIVVPWEGGE